MISVLLASKDRQNNLYSCLKSILRNTYKNFEVVVIDQSKTSLHKKIDKLKSSKIRYFHKPGNGKSVALNFAVSKASGGVFAFTDDDCIVSKNWLSDINSSFSKNPKIACVFGQTFPYKPKRHKGLICPATTSQKSMLFRDPNMVFSANFGKGNNMAWKKDVLDSMGGFKTWLGPGAKTGTAGGEETELAYRALTSGYQMGFNSKMLVYHDRFVTKEEDYYLHNKKCLGNVAFLFYYFMRDKKSFLFRKIFIFRIDTLTIIKGCYIGLSAYLARQ